MLLLSYYELIIEVMSYCAFFSYVFFLNFKILPLTGKSSWKYYSVGSKSQLLIINRKNGSMAPSLLWHISSYNYSTIF